MEPLGFDDGDASDAGSPPAPQQWSPASAGLEQHAFTLKGALDDAEFTPERLDPNAHGIHQLTITVYRSVATKARALSIAGWDRDSRRLFEQAFKGLIDAWPAYDLGLAELDRARKSDELSAVGAMMALARPRRAYIEALQGFYGQLRVVLHY